MQDVAQGGADRLLGDSHGRRRSVGVGATGQEQPTEGVGGPERIGHPQGVQGGGSAHGCQDGSGRREGTGPNGRGGRAGPAVRAGSSLAVGGEHVGWQEGRQVVEGGFGEDFPRQRTQVGQHHGDGLRGVGVDPEGRGATLDGAPDDLLSVEDGVVLGKGQGRGVGEVRAAACRCLAHSAGRGVRAKTRTGNDGECGWFRALQAGAPGAVVGQQAAVDRAGECPAQAPGQLPTSGRVVEAGRAEP